jgi:hypothetical protein
MRRATNNGALHALVTRGVQKLCQCPRVQFINSIRRRLGFPGYQGVINRDLCAARQTNRARLTSTRRIWYSRARVKPDKAYRRGPCCEKVPSRPTEIDRRSGCVLVLVDQPAEQVPAI